MMQFAVGYQHFAYGAKFADEVIETLAETDLNTRYSSTATGSYGRMFR